MRTQPIGIHAAIVIAFLITISSASPAVAQPSARTDDFTIHDQTQIGTGDPIVVTDEVTVDLARVVGQSTEPPQHLTTTIGETHYDEVRGLDSALRGRKAGDSFQVDFPVATQRPGFPEGSKLSPGTTKLTYKVDVVAVKTPPKPICAPIHTQLTTTGIQLTFDHSPLPSQVAVMRTTGPDASPVIANWVSVWSTSNKRAHGWTDCTVGGPAHRDSKAFCACSQPTRDAATGEWHPGSDGIIEYRVTTSPGFPLHLQLTASVTKAPTDRRALSDAGVDGAAPNILKPGWGASCAAGPDGDRTCSSTGSITIVFQGVNVDITSEPFLAVDGPLAPIVDALGLTGALGLYSFLYAAVLRLLFHWLGRDSWKTKPFSSFFDFRGGSILTERGQNAGLGAVILVGLMIGVIGIPIWTTYLSASHTAIALTTDDIAFTAIGLVAWAVLGMPAWRPKHLVARIVVAASIGLSFTRLGGYAVGAGALCLGWGVSEAIARAATIRDFWVRGESANSIEDGLRQRAWRGLRAQILSGQRPLASYGFAISAAPLPMDTLDVAIGAAVFARAGNHAPGIAELQKHQPKEGLEAAFASIAYATPGDTSAGARSAYLGVFSLQPQAPWLEAELRDAFERGIPPSKVSVTMKAEIDFAQRTRPDWNWWREAAALLTIRMGEGPAEGTDFGSLVATRPTDLAGRETVAVEAVVKAGSGGRVLEHVRGLFTSGARPPGTPEPIAYLEVLSAFAELGAPLPRAVELLAPAQPTESAKRVALLRVLVAASLFERARPLATELFARRGELLVGQRRYVEWAFARCACAGANATALAQLRGSLSSVCPAAQLELALGEDDNGSLAALLEEPGFIQDDWERCVVARAQLCLGQPYEAVETVTRVFESSPARRLVEARAGAREDALDEAIATLEKMLANYPEFPEARRALGRAYLKKGAIGAAFKHFSSAASNGDGHADVGVAETYRRGGDPARAIASLEALFAKSERSIEALRDGATLAVRLGNAALAAKFLTPLKEVLGERPLVARIEGALAELKGDPGGALECYERALAFDRMGALALRTGDRTRAFLVFERIPERTIATMLDPVLFGIATAAVASGDLRRADIALSTLSKRRPNDRDAVDLFASVRCEIARGIVEGRAPGGFDEARDALLGIPETARTDAVRAAITSLELKRTRQLLLAADADAAPRLAALVSKTKGDLRAGILLAWYYLLEGQSVAANAAIGALGSSAWAAYLRGLRYLEDGTERDAAAREFAQAMTSPDPVVSTAAWVAIARISPPSEETRTGLSHLLEAETQ